MVQAGRAAHAMVAAQRAAHTTVPAEWKSESVPMIEASTSPDDLRAIP